MEDILEPIRRDQVSLWLDGDTLRSRPLSGRLSTELADHLQRHESDLVAFLQAADGNKFGPPPKLTAGSLDGRFKMSFLQEMSVVLYAPSTVRTFNLISGMRITGSLITDLLHQSIKDLTRRHAILRAFIGKDEHGKPWLFIRDHIDFSLDGLHVCDVGIQPAAKEYGARLFDLENGPLFRVALGKLENQQHLLVIVLHHAIADGWSIPLIWMEILRRYNALATFRTTHLSAAPLAIQFTDVMHYRHAWLRWDSARKARAYWRQRLSCCADPFGLPYDRTSPVPAVSPYPVSGQLEFGDCARVVALCKQERISLSTLSLAMFAMLLSRWSGKSDVVTWVTHAGRRHREVLGVVGCFFDTWLLRVEISRTMTVMDAVRAVNAAVVDALPTLELPGSQMLEQFTSVRGQDLKRIIMFNFMPGATDADKYARKLTSEEIEKGAVQGKVEELAPAAGHFEQGAIVALYLTLFGSDNSLSWAFRHDPVCFEDSTIQDLSHAFHSLLVQFVTENADGASATSYSNGGALQ